MFNGLTYSNFCGLVYDTSDSQILHSTLPKSRKEAISQQRRSFILKYIMAVSNTYITIIFSNNKYTLSYVKYTEVYRKVPLWKKSKVKRLQSGKESKTSNHIQWPVLRHSTVQISCNIKIRAIIRRWDYKRSAQRQFWTKRTGKGNLSTFLFVHVSFSATFSLLYLH